MTHEYHKSMSWGMFDFSKFYDHLVTLLPPRPRLVEVGVADGASSIYLAEKLLSEGKTFEFHLVDNFSYGTENQMNELISHICRAGLGEGIHIMPLDSLNASCHFPDHLFDSVFLDSSHLYEQTKAEIRLWYRKVIDGGYLSGHDYHSCPPVKKAVDELIDPVRLVTYRTEKGNGIWMVQKEPGKEI